jgi:adenine-specific DNA-methyltransferase
VRAISPIRRTAAVSSHSIIKPALAVIRPVSEMIADFPATRYYGSKRKLLPWIYQNIRGLEFDTVLDALGGTASVSLLFRAMRKNVTYHDGFKFNQDIGRTLLSNGVALSRADLLDFLHGIVPRHGFITEKFAGMYYTNKENSWLDGFAEKLQNGSASSAFSKKKASLLRYLLYQACLKKRPFNLFHRANLHLRTKRNVTRSFGNHVTWERTFEHHILQAYDELLPIFPAQAESTVLPSGNVGRLKPGYDLVYIDPPYINTISRYNRDDYWRRYHFLEGLAHYDKWKMRIDPTSDIGLLRQPSWMADWSKKSTFPARLFSLIKTHSESQVVLSYVTNAYPEELEIKELFEDTFSSVSIHSREHNHALGVFPRRELLFIGRP